MRLASLAVVAALVSGTAVSAATVVGAKRLRIASAAATPLAIAEVEAFDFNYYNVASAALGATASGSAGSSGAAAAIDGVTGGAVFAAGGATDALEISFFRPFALGSIRVHGVPGDIYSVTIFGAASDLLFTGQIDALAGPTPLYFDVPRNGGGYRDAADLVGRNFGANAVPEPGVWALLITGFGLIGATLRRRRTGAATA